jgi:hypothetical protein
MWLLGCVGAASYQDTGFSRAIKEMKKEYFVVKSTHIALASYQGTGFSRAIKNRKKNYFLTAVGRRTVPTEPQSFVSGHGL